MIRHERIVESQATALAITDAQAYALTELGRRLASDRFWGPSLSGVDGDTSVIKCVRDVSGAWVVRVQDAVGVVTVNGLTLIVEPKIPLDHLRYLLSIALEVPRLADQRSDGDLGDGFWELVASWLVRSVQQVLRRDLARDYRPTHDVLPVVRGRINNLATARRFYAGQLHVDCAFDDFVADTPLNRVLRAALREVAASRVVSTAVRRRASSLVSRFDGVSELSENDLWPTVDRRTHYYRDALTLAKHVLLGKGRTIDASGHVAWCFLMRTPDVVESAIRTLLAAVLAPIPVVKRSSRLSPGITVNPDLVFADGGAVGDVKYKVSDDGWNRPDLYEVVAFASAFRTTRALLVSFAPQAIAMPSLSVGAISVTSLCWDCSLPPETAGRSLMDRVASWFTEPSSP